MRTSSTVQRRTVAALCCLFFIASTAAVHAADTGDQSLLGFYARWQVSRIMPFAIELGDTAQGDPEIRNAFETALRTVSDRPTGKIVPTALDKIRASEDGPTFHWSDGDADWLRVSWDAKDDGN